MTINWCQVWCQYFQHIGINPWNLLQLLCIKMNRYKQIQIWVNPQNHPFLNNFLKIVPLYL